jgi:hypothetical protein
VNYFSESSIHSFTMLMQKDVKVIFLFADDEELIPRRIKMTI